MFSKSKLYRIWKIGILPLIDFSALMLGAGLVYLIRYRWYSDGFSGVKNITGVEYLELTASFSLVVVLIYALIGMYSIIVRENWVKTALKLTLGLFLPLLALVTFLFFYEFERQILPSGVQISRFILAVGGFLSLYFIFLFRLGYWALEKLLHAFGVGQSDIVIIGKFSINLINHLESKSEYSKIWKFESLNSTSYNYIEKLIKKDLISEVYLMSNNEEYSSRIAELCERKKIDFLFSPLGISFNKAYEMHPMRVGNSLLIELKHSKLDGWYFIFKRLFDIIFSILFLLLFWWIYVIIILAIRIESKGPIFYINQRVSPNGKKFGLIKFRRMKPEYCVSKGNKEALEFEKKLIHEHSSKNDIQYKIFSDPRNTKVGSFLEKYSLDELPQFINVLKGDMSIVGPRPHQVRDVKKYKDYHYKVLNIKPGITGMAQVNGRSDNTFDKEVELDVYYIENWSFWLDLKIIILTPLVMFFPNHKS